MFVRFREYDLAKGGRTLCCEIIENYRDRCSGKVRQRSISYLGSVRKQWLQYPRVRMEFWRRVEVKLSGLPLSEIEAQRIRLAIDERVPREATPTLRQGTTRKASNVSATASVPLQSLSSPAAGAPEQSAEELLAALQRSLGMNS